MKKVAVILAGCGYLDGSEIREAVFTLLALDKMGAEFSIFAPNITQHHVIDHLHGSEMKESRNVLIESARIARGKIQPLDELQESDFDSIILPGGFGAAKNLSDIAFKGASGSVIEPVISKIKAFHKAKKPIGAICISPAIVALVLRGENPILTLGKESTLLEEMKVSSVKCDTTDIIVDKDNKLASTPAYMHDDSLSNIYIGIEKLVKYVMEL